MKAYRTFANFAAALCSIIMLALFVMGLPPNWGTVFAGFAMGAYAYMKARGE